MGLIDMQGLSIVSVMDYGKTVKFGGESHFWLIIGGITAIVVLSAITTVIWLKHKKKA